MDLSTYALTKKIAESAVSGVESMTVDGTTLNINTKDGNNLKMVFPTPKDGVQGPQGEPGVNGKDGYTPVKGVDYFTEADKSELVGAVINALPKAESEVY